MKICNAFDLTNTQLFRTLMRVNLGGDTFTVGALCICTLCTFLGPPLLVILSFWVPVKDNYAIDTWQWAQAAQLSCRNFIVISS